MFFFVYVSVYCTCKIVFANICRCLKIPAGGGGGGGGGGLYAQQNQQTMALTAIKQE